MLPFLRDVLFVAAGGILGWYFGAPIGSAPSPPSNPAISARSQTAAHSTATESPTFAHILELGQRRGNLQDDAELYEALKSMRPEDFRDAASLWTTEVQAKLASNEVQTGAILDRWFELDPPSARQFAEAVIQSSATDQQLSLIRFRRLLTASAARHDPQWAIQNLLRFNKVYYAENPNTSLMAEVTKRDPALAKEWLARLEVSNLRQSMIHGYVAGLAETDPVAALDAALGEKNFDQPDLIGTAIQAAARQGGNSAKIALERISDPARRREASLKAIETLTLETLIDPFQFINDTIGIDHLEAVKDRLRSSSRYLTAAYPEATANWALQLPPKIRTDFLNSAIAAWNERDPDAALAWMLDKEGSSESSIAEMGRLSAANRLIDQGKMDEAKAALSQATQAGSLLTSVALRIGKDDPEFAGQWISRLPESKESKDAARRFAEGWTEVAPSAAAAWVQQLPSGGTRDTALGSMIFVAAQHDPKTASRWVDLISDVKQRKYSVDTVFGYWTDRDPVAAREWVMSVPGLDERWKIKFLRQNE
jgi:hypothetical protein